MDTIKRRAASLLPDNSPAQAMDLLRDKSRKDLQKELMDNKRKANKREQAAKELASRVCETITDEDLFGPLPESPTTDIDDYTQEDVLDVDVLDSIASRPASELTEEELTLLSAHDPLAAARKREERHAATLIERANFTNPYALTHRPASQSHLPEPVTNPEMLELFHSLSVNLNSRLNKSDTMNLLASLLTCSEEQLDALHSSARVPIALKIVIKRLLIDAQNGDMEAVEKLWDRVFGKQPAVDPTAHALPSDSPLAGLLPSGPVSREAYLIIREHIIGK